jgi:L-lysine exporter family protein LysE/ArgO
MDLAAALAGLGFGLSLIVAIGAQNAFVLRQGLRRRHVGTVVAVCAVSDIVLIAAGVAGAGALLRAAPGIVDVAQIGGGAFLLAYAALAARRVWRPGTLHAAPDEDAPRRRAAATAALAFTWLNPHVYLDTMVLLGSVAAAHGDGRWSFGLGAACGSVLWFCCLGFGARLLQRPFASPGAWRALDGAIALVMGATGVSLVAASM